jgi:hypothetical protein
MIKFQVARPKSVEWIIRILLSISHNSIHHRKSIKKNIVIISIIIMLFITKLAVKQYLFDCISYPLCVFGRLLTSLGNDLRHVSSEHDSNMVAIHREDSTTKPVLTNKDNQDQTLKNKTSDDGFVTIGHGKGTKTFSASVAVEKSRLNAFVSPNYYDPLCTHSAGKTPIKKSSPNIIDPFNSKGPDSGYSGTAWSREHSSTRSVGCKRNSRSALESDAVVGTLAGTMFHRSQR